MAVAAVMLPGCNVAVDQHQWCCFGLGAAPILVGIGMFTGGTGV